MSNAIEKGGTRGRQQRAPTLAAAVAALLHWSIVQRLQCKGLQQLLLLLIDACVHTSSITVTSIVPTCPSRQCSGVPVLQCSRTRSSHQKRSGVDIHPQQLTFYRLPLTTPPSPTTPSLP